MRQKKLEHMKQEIRRMENRMPNQRKAPGEIQGLSKHMKKNNGQGRGQRVKAGSRTGQFDEM